MVSAPLRIALAGLAALAVAMGIGRFAFTPILPMMLHDGVVDLPRASWLASTNYVGYLVGALLCAFGPRLRRRWPLPPPLDGTAWVRIGLAATVLLTLAMAAPWPSAWPVLRFLAGVASAVVFVHSSGWCLARLAALRAPRLGGVMYAGPGAGIVASGLIASALVAWHGRASTAWMVFALLAAVLSAAVWGVFVPVAAVPAATSPSAADDATASATPMRPLPATAPAPPSGRAEVATLAVAYGCAGFGYIVTATFLPVIARVAIAGSPLIDLFWPVFGAGVFAGALMASRMTTTVDRRVLLAAAYAVQAAGIALGIVLPSEAGFALGSLLLGLPFTALTFFAMQEVRRVRPDDAASTIGLLTACYGLGQIVGPPMVGVLLAHAAEPNAAFRQSLAIAAASLVVGAVLYLVSWRAWPERSRTETGD